MEEKLLKLITYYDEDQYFTQHEAYLDGKRVFRAADLTDCPEDAIIGRDIFDGDDFIRAVKMGYEMSQDGYKLVVEHVEAKTQDEFDALCSNSLSR